MKAYILLFFTFFISICLKSQNYLKISSDHRGGRDGREIVNFIAIDTASVKKLIFGKQKDEISLDINHYYQLDSLNYFALIKYLKTKNLLYLDIRSYEYGEVFEIIDKEKKVTYYKISGLSVITYKKIRSKITRLSKIKDVLRLLDKCFK
jgi:hypothetical protein